MSSFILIVKEVLKSLLLKIVFHTTGLYGFILNILFNYVWGKFFQPAINMLRREEVKRKEKDKVKIQVDEIKKSKTEKEWDDAVDHLD